MDGAMQVGSVGGFFFPTLVLKDHKKAKGNEGEERRSQRLAVITFKNIELTIQIF